MFDKVRKFASLATLVLLSIVWLSSLAGFAYLTSYAYVPGKIGNVPTNITGHLDLVRSKTPYTLLLFLHPECPCSRATLSELTKIMAHTDSDLTVHILFWQPFIQSASNQNLSKENKDWTDTALIRLAKKLPKTEITNDDGGKLAQQFGVKTSGTALLYDKDGKLLFRGGITQSRGHEGDNPGASTVYQLVKNQTINSVAPDVRSKQAYSSPVFGCSL